MNGRNGMDQLSRFMLYLSLFLLIVSIILFSLLNKGAGNELSSQAVARQVFSPRWVFTTVFGMGTGVFLTLGHQQIFLIFSD